MRPKIITAVVLGLLLFVLTPGSARAENVSLVYDLNFYSNKVSIDKWSRLEVFVTNKGDKDIEGTLTVSAGGQYSQEVFVEAGKSVSAVFYLPPVNMGLGLHNASIALGDSRGREVQRLHFGVTEQGITADYVGVLGSSVKGLNEFANTLPNAHVVSLGPEHLDHSLFAENFSIIVINDPQTVMLNSQQQENLRFWLEQGGVLILGGGSGWQRTLDLVPAELAPILPQGVTTVTAADLTVLKLPVPLSQQDYSIALGKSKGTGTVLQAVGDIPLLVQQKIGQGGVLWSALDLAASPLDNTGNQIAYWQQMLLYQPVKADPLALRQSWLTNNMFNTIAQGDVTSALSPLKIFIALLVYIVLAGPINWLVLRKLDRREWAWLTIPILAIIFATGTFVVGRGDRSSQHLLYQLNLIQVQSENLARVDSQGGVFVPNRGQVGLTSTAAAFAPREGGVLTQTGAGTRITFDNPPLWSVQRFMASDYLKLPGNFSIRAKLSGLGAPTLAVDIVNNSGHALFNSYIRLGSNWYEIGPVERDATLTVSASTKGYIDVTDIFSRYSKYGHYSYDINELLPSAPFLFIGFGEEGVLSVDGAAKAVDKARALDLWIQAFDLGSIDFGQGSVDIPRGFLTPELSMGSGSLLDRWGNTFDFRGQGNFDFVFTLPANLDYSQGLYSLNLGNIWGDAQGRLLVYNHNASEWHELSTLKNILSSPTTIQLEDPGALILNQRLLVRVEYDGSLGFDAGGIDLTLEGGSYRD